MGLLLRALRDRGGGLLLGLALAVAAVPLTWLAARILRNRAARREIRVRQLERAREDATRSLRESHRRELTEALVGALARAVAAREKAEAAYRIAERVDRAVERLWTPSELLDRLREVDDAPR